MPYFRLADNETGDVKEVRRMDKSVASKLNETAENGHRWRMGLEVNGSPNPIRSITQLTRLLDTEGFGEWHLNAIQRHLDYEANAAVRQRDQFDKLRERFKEVCAPLPEADRKVIGKFIAKQHGHAFTTGLRLGLTGGIAADALEHEKECN